MSRVVVHMKGALEPLYLNEPLNATGLNMSAAMKNNMIFFQADGEDGNTVLISIPNILYMIEED